MADILERFFNGEYAGLVRDHVDSGPLDRFPNLERAYLIGALVFIGRRQDAHAEFAAHLSNDTLDACTIARFFLGLGACRDSEYAQARGFFSENLRALASLESSEARFFAHQGMGFFRFFCSRFAKSRLWTERAWRLAFSARFRYGMILSADLHGHVLVATGRVAEGLKTFETALDLNGPKAGGVQVALEISMISYRAQHGLLAHASFELRKRLKTLAPTDTYSRSNLSLELARALILEGKADTALQALEQSAQEIFRSGHRRQKAMLLSRRAHALIRQGRMREASAAIEEGLGYLDSDADLAHRLELMGLKFHIDAGPELRASIEQLTRLTGRRIARRILSREVAAGAVIGDDPLGLLLDQIAKDPQNVELVLETQARGWLGILSRFVEREEGIVLSLDLLPGRLVVFHRGNVHVSKAQVPATLRSLLIILAQGASTKQKLVETVWGYKYDSLRHDPMLYNSIYRLRQLLGPFEDRLVAADDGYSWTETVAARVFERAVAVKKDPTPMPGEARSLTLRQRRALEMIKKLQAVSAAEYAKAMKVAKATATRDLAELVETGHLEKSGRARATTYSIHDPMKELI